GKGDGGDRGRALAHARLTVYAGEHELGGGTGIDGVADESGRFRHNPWPGRYITVTAYPPEGEPYLIRKKLFQWPKGSVKQKVEIKLPRGVLVKGKLTEAGSGKPGAGSAPRSSAWPT